MSPTSRRWCARSSSTGCRWRGCRTTSSRNGATPTRRAPTESAARKLPDETVLAWNKALPIIKLPDTGRLCARDRLARRLPGGHRAAALGPGVDGALLRRARRGPRQLARQRQRRRTLRGHRPGAAPARSQHRARRTGAAWNRTARIPATRQRRARLLREDQSSARSSARRAWRATSRKPSARRSKCCAPTRPLFTRYVEARRNRRDDWYIVPAGHIDVCSISIPVR